MKNLLWIAAWLAFMPSYAFAGGPGDRIIAIKTQAETMANALIKKDYNTYVKYMHPKNIREMGGTKGVIDSLKKVEGQMARYGSVIENISVNDPSPMIDTGGEIQCTITETVEVQVKGGIVESEVVFIGVSKDKGNHWVFLDVTTDYDSIRKEFPDLSAQLAIPVANKPIFRQD